MEFIIGGTLLAVLGIVSPFIVSLLTKVSMSAKAKQLVAIAVAFVLSVVVAFIPELGGTAVLDTANGFEGVVKSFVVALPVVYAISQVIYAFIFKGTQWANTLADTGVKDKEDGSLDLESELNGVEDETLDTDGTGHVETEDGGLTDESDEYVDAASGTKGE